MREMRPKQDQRLEFRFKSNQASVRTLEEPPRWLYRARMFLSPTNDKWLQGQAISRNLEIINNFGLPWCDLLLHTRLLDRPDWKTCFYWFFQDLCAHLRAVYWVQILCFLEKQTGITDHCFATEQYYAWPTSNLLPPFTFHTTLSPQFRNIRAQQASSWWSPH